MRLVFTSLLLFLSSFSLYAQTPTLTPDSRPFLLPVEDVFTITGRGVVVTGTVERGVLKVGDTVEIVGIKATKTATVTGIEVFRKMLDEAKAGDNIGVLLRGVTKEDVVRGQVLAKSGSVKAYKKFKAKIDLLPTANGGRSTPLTDTFRPLIYARTQSFSGTVKLPNGKTSIDPGEKGVEVEISVTEPVALDKGQSVAIREGNRTIGNGTVTVLMQ
jgi:elongation factor Tu